MWEVRVHQTDSCGRAKVEARPRSPSKQDTESIGGQAKKGQEACEKGTDTKYRAGFLHILNISKNPEWRTKLKKDPGIPNLFPFKDKILHEIEETKRKKAEDQERRKEEARARRKEVASVAGDEVMAGTVEDDDDALLDLEDDDDASNPDNADEDMGDAVGFLEHDR